MEKQIIFIDIFNQKYLQFIDLYTNEMQWTSELTQCSFYQGSEVEAIMNVIEEHYDGECWIEVKVIHVKQAN